MSRPPRSEWAAAATLAVLAVAAGCRPVMGELRPLPRRGGEGQDPEALLAEARAGFALRPDARAVATAHARYLQAAEADPRGIEGLYGAVMVAAWRIEHEPEAGRRAVLVDAAMQAAGHCAQRLPESPRCHYALAIALGLQAREHPSSALEALGRIIELLGRAAAAEPGLDRGGPSRVLALLRVRAPGWPLGPGDPEAAVEAGRAALAQDPDYPPNRLALAEALLAAQDGGARAAAELGLARARAQLAREPDAPDWILWAEQLLARLR